MNDVASVSTLTSAFDLTHSKLEALRDLLRSVDLDGLLVLHADEHLNEYLPQHRRRREWLTGFTGSAGDVLISLGQAWLTVDSRYFEQAEQQVNRDDFTLIKLDQPQEPTLEDTIEGLGSGFRLGVDPFTITVSRYQELADQAEAGGVIMVPTPTNWIDQLRASWEKTDPSHDLAAQPVVALSETVTGASIQDKLQQVREQMAKKRVQVLPVTKLDQIAWLFNLRGSDIPYNPVFIAYAVITPEEGILCTRMDRLTDSAQAALETAGIQIEPYEAYAEILIQAADRYGRVGVDPKRTTQGTVTILAGRANREMDHPIEALKACKNAVELDRMRQANQQASRAKIRTLAWIEAQLQQGQRLSEADVAARIEHYYAQEPHWRGLSFNSIAATGAHSSIVHYGTPDPNTWLEPGQLLLIDSGSHYEGGTTDDTRTVMIGDPTLLQRQRYTEVLKAHIQCASQRFPLATPGTLLDGITRSNLWQVGMNYGHGTGHGVGAYLNVHEGPNGISRRSHAKLKAGMITSIEPGYYEPGWGGIRIENLCEIQTVPDQEDWLQFKPLTWIPFDQTLIDETLLTSDQREWIRTYHQQVYELHAETLNDQELDWLRRACGVGG